MITFIAYLNILAIISLEWFPYRLDIKSIYNKEHSYFMHDDNSIKKSAKN